ncbi:protein sisterless A [Scaptodrosophila lebanonensis]|uniref:Protein sisterless A n=1 Tax=Drosophila lebanonensis TaxID=7225 RepID=A0A6J2TRJ4_DROLE|nr:protein sisterless A [Scaptodrosophila lebanonensis]
MEQNLFLHKFYAQIGDVNLRSAPIMAHQYQRPSLPLTTHTNYSHNKPEQIDELVAVELQHLKTHYADEEQRYVDQMLLENPIVVERRAASKSESSTTTTTTTEMLNATPVAMANTMTTHANGRDVQRQRAESCRKSRYNNKIKKAKLRFRHKFVCNQLAESANVLDYIRGVIAQAETQLLARGFNRAALERMRQNFGVDRCVTSSLDAIEIHI